MACGFRARVIDAFALLCRYAGQVKQKNADGTFDVLYDDGDTEAAVPKGRVRAPPAQRSRFEEYVKLTEANRALVERVRSLERDKDRLARRVLGGAHPTTVDMGECLQESRAALRTRETPASSA